MIVCVRFSYFKTRIVVQYKEQDHLVHAHVVMGMLLVCNMLRVKRLGESARAVQCRAKEEGDEWYS